MARVIHHVDKAGSRTPLSEEQLEALVARADQRTLENVEVSEDGEPPTRPWRFTSVEPPGFKDEGKTVVI